MSGVSAIKQRYSPTPFHETVEEISRRHAIKVRVKCRGGRGATARLGRRDRASTITVSRLVLQEDPSVQRFVAAHEMAHLALRHGSGPLLAAIPYFAVALLGLVVPLLNAGAAGLKFTLGLLVLVLVPLPSALLGLRRFIILTRPYELAADQLARTWGYYLDEAGEAWLAKQESAIVKQRWYQPWRLHPPASERSTD